MEAEEDPLITFRRSPEDPDLWIAWTAWPETAASLGVFRRTDLIQELRNLVAKVRRDVLAAWRRPIPTRYQEFFLPERP